MRVVLDSNIFFSSLISRVATPARIVNAWLDGSFDLITCEQQMHELQRLSRHSKFSGYFFPHEFGRLINEMKPYIHSGPSRANTRATIPTTRTSSTWRISLKRTF